MIYVSISISQIGVPMSLAQKTNSLWEPLLDLAECGNMNCKSDLQVNNQDVVFKAPTV